MTERSRTAADATLGAGEDRPGDRIGPYELCEIVGRGGMGVVFRGRDCRSDRTVAVKLLRPDSTHAEARFRFEREAQTLASLRHPAIVEHIAHGTGPDGAMYLVMEWLDGCDLSTRLERGRIALDDAIRLGCRIAAGLDAAHRAGIVHRDLKPSNVFLPGGSLDDAKLLDFGVARLSAARGLTRTGGVVGTPGYMSPEQARGDVDVDHRTDLFSLGCLLFECLTGAAPFRGAHVMAVLAKILLEDPPRPGATVRDVPEWLDELVASSLAKHRHHRPPTAEAVLVTLRERRLAFVPAGRSAMRLGDRERVLLSVVLVRPPVEEPITAVDASIGSNDATQAGITVVARDHGGRVIAIADGSFLVVLEAHTVPSDHALAAARCALALAERFPLAAVALAFGEAVVTGQSLVGRVVDLGTRLLADAPPGRVVVDDAIARLLDGHFEVQPLGDGASLLGDARARPLAERRVLGRRMPFVGRRRELALLEGLFAQVVEERDPVTAVVIGEPGLGKSRLRREFVARITATEPDARVLQVGAEPLTSGAALGLLGSLVRVAAGIEPADDAQAREKRLRELVAFAPAPDRERLAAFLGLAMGMRIDVEDPELGASLDDPRVQREAIPEAWNQWLAATTAKGPVLLVLDDAQWADDATLELLSSSQRRLGRASLMIVLLARPELRDRRDLAALAGLEEVILQPLAQRAAEELARGALGDDGSSVDVARLVGLAGGNPLLLEELVRAAAAGMHDGAPQSVIGVLQSRLHRIDARTRRALRAGAVFGERFWTEGVAALVGGDVHEVRSDLADLVAHELVERAHVGTVANAEEWVFRHALVRDAAYETLTADDAALGHRLAAQWLEGLEETQASVLAEHWERGRAPERAVEWFERAAEQALRSTDFRLVVAWADRGLRHATDEPTRARLAAAKAEGLCWMADYPAAIEWGTRALASFEPRQPEWIKTAHHLAEAMGRAGRLEELEALLATVLAAREHDVEGRVAVLANGAEHLVRMARFARAKEITTAIDREVAGEQSLGPMVRVALNQLAMSWADSEADPWRARASLLENLDIAERSGMVELTIATHAALGHITAQLGANVEAEQYCTDARDLGESLGMSHLAFTHNGMLALLALRRGDVEPARTLIDRAFRQDARDPRMLGALTVLRAKVSLAEGDAAGAEEHAARALASLSEVRPLRAWAHAELVGAALRRSDVDAALEHAESALQIVDEFGALSEFESDVHVALVEALQAAGRIEEARERLEAFAGRLRVRASWIPDASYRASFLRGVPANARLLELAGLDADELASAPARTPET